MDLPELKSAALDGKRVLMRVDFNVEFANGKPKERYKIFASRQSIDFILSKPGVKLALVSHLGRPEGPDKNFSFKELCPELTAILGRELLFVEDCIGEKVKESLKNNKLPDYIGHILGI